MVKSVPEWLNSSIWSTPNPSSDDRLQRYATKPSEETLTLKPDPIPPPQRPDKAAIAVPTPHEKAPPQHADKAPIPVSTSHEKTPPSSVEEPETLDSNANLSPEDVDRRARFFSELSRKVIDLRELRRLGSQGIPDCAGLRPTIWKLLLGYLPNDRDMWANELAKKRSQYALFREELLLNPDTEIAEQIDRDVKRTHPDMHFFSGDSALARSNQEALKNILLIFAKLNPGIRYVQGMNEVLAPLFYVFQNDPDEKSAAHAEADAFFCFVELLSGFRDHFCQQLDNSVVGIRSTITKLSQLLREHDEELWRHLEVTTKVNPQFYAFRWITLLLTQEFNFADSLHIWDTLLSDPDGPLETLLRICCAMLILIRRRLLAGDFTSNLKLLQNYPSANISHLLYVADKLRARARARAHSSV
ncbi:TBC1 domain family member 13 isoform X2 [Amborella trichopoda]|uniref:TBC1 domain family member 13 isoform X2 n=1 Tax=Amborella trichopoda TaxID=13333 RepID=UPI0009BF5915|nr:TBC1 domain family member 13 isoform X2 [Amborella trichopoda]|eukprot:XP_020526552.1 TBC1 domain family member 13 isoform X2 [Amborella trichopoda]